LSSLPFLSIKEISDNINKSHDLLVSNLLVLKIFCNIECNTLLGRVADTASLLLVNILNFFSCLALHILFRNNLYFILYFFIFSWLLATDKTKSMQNAWQEIVLNCDLSDILVLRFSEYLSQDLVVELDSILLLLFPVLFPGFITRILIRHSIEYLKYKFFASMVAQILLEEHGHLGE